MKSNLLTTKLHRPSPPPRWVRRPHIVQRLQEGLAAGRQLTLVSAPAGFGKTTSVIEWLAVVELPVAWLSLDKADDDPGRFFQYLVAALQKVDLDFGRDIDTVLRSGQLPPVEVITSTLINDISEYDGRFLLVLDDLHVIQDPSILDVLEVLVANQPPQLHLVLLTREDPLLPLARLRANNQMTEVRTSDLRFAGEEVGHFLEMMVGLSLAESDILALESRTEGWVVGLQLAGLGMRARTDVSTFIANLSGTHRYILSYLMDEVLNQQPAEIQAFLLQSSILDKLNGDLCNAVTGRGDSAELLEHLLAANLFLIPLDDEQKWYRYHHLFADLLRNQQSRVQKDLDVVLHQRASQWYAGAGMIPEAVEHALAASDYTRAIQLLERHTIHLLTQGYAKTIETWMEAIPPEWHSQSPNANLAFAWLHLLRGNYALVQPYLKQVEQVIGSTAPSQETRALQAEWHALQANLLNIQAKPAESIEQANQALQLLDPQNHYVLGLAYLGLGGAYRMAGDYPKLVDAYQKAIQNSRASGGLLTELLAVSALTLTSIQFGQLRYAANAASEMIERIQRAGSSPPPVSASVYGSLGMVHYEWNQLEKTDQLFARSYQLSGLSGHNAGLVYTNTLLSRRYEAEGDLDAAASAIRKASELLAAGVPAWLLPEVAAQQVRIFLARRQPAMAEEVLTRTGITPQAAITYRNIQFHLAWLRLQLAVQQHWPDATGYAGRIIATATQSGQVGFLIQALLLRAILYDRLGNTNAANQDLDQAVRLAEPEGYLRTFLDEGQEIAALLRRYAAVAGSSAYASILLTAFGQQAPAVDGEPNMALAEPLTERELEVLELMAEGLKYEEIASRLVITLNTVRFHVKSLYGKLGVNNRTRAIELARQLSLI